MDYIVELDKFSGPLDLLLHLIKQSDIDIRDISILDITEQYLNYINKIESMNLNVASEYLVMAAELIEMKSKILLPITETEEEITNELIEKLVDYKNYKDLVEKFKSMELDRKDYYTKDPSLELDIDIKPNLTDDLSLDDLVNAFSIYLNRKELEKPLNTKITNKEYSVKKRTDEIRNIIKNKKNVCFNELFTVYNKSYIVVTFLAILNLAKEKEIIIKQENNFENFYISEVI